MNILVTGATGLIGVKLVERLLREGHKVAIATRRPFRAEDLFAQRVRAFEWHPSCDAAPTAMADGIEAVVHLAAPASDAPGDDARRLAADRLAVLFHGRPIRLVVAMPIVAPTGGDVMTEASRLAPADPARATDIAAAEARCNALAADSASVVIVRLGLLLDADGIFGDLADLARRGLEPRFAGACIPVIDPEDAVAMLAGLVGRPEFTGPVLGVAPEPLPGALLDAQLRRLRRFPLALPMGRRLVERRLGPLAALLYNRTRIVPQRLIEAGAGFLHPDARPRLEALVTRLASDVPERAWPWRAKPAARPIG